MIPDMLFYMPYFLIGKTVNYQKFVSHKTLKKFSTFKWGKVPIYVIIKYLIAFQLRKDVF